PLQWAAEDDRDIGAAEAAVPARPGLVGPGDCGGDHGDACPEDEADGTEPGGLEAAIPAPFALDVDADAVAFVEPAEDEADGLRVGLEAADRKGQEARHEPAHGRARELCALGHGVERPRADGLDEDGIE